MAPGRKRLPSAMCPLLGKKYAVEVKPGRTTLLRDGKVVLRAENKVMRETIAH
jgi:hypothetical protein